MERGLWSRIAEKSGRPLDLAQLDLLETYHDWLGTEAIITGGIGPLERDRLATRHLGDSLLFSRFLTGPELVWDLGSGVGLPGIPLAIMSPDTRFVLIDRAGRRVDLMRRVIRLLGLENVDVRHTDLHSLSGETPAIVSRAVMAPGLLTEVVRRHLRPGGIAVVGGSWSEPPDQPGWETVEVGRDTLDHDVWLLMMRAQ